MSCHRYHIDRPISEEERQKLLDELLGEAAPAIRERPLDEVLASRSHVRVIRLLSLLGEEINLTGRDIARRAELSHTRVQEVLSGLVAARLVTRYREANWAIYEMNRSSPLTPVLRALFEQERDLTPA